MNTRLRQLEDEQHNLREMLEEEEESKRSVEKQVATLQTQVSPTHTPLTPPGAYTGTSPLVPDRELRVELENRPIFKCVHFLIHPSVEL